MILQDYLEQKNITKYRLSKISGVPYTVISDISTGKSQIKNCTGETIYRLARALDITMEDLLVDNMEYRQCFETYKSNICHMVNEQGDIDFIISILESDEIRKLYKKKWYPESLYLLAMVDYLSRENNLPLCTQYSDIRSVRLNNTIYPSSVVALSIVSQSEQPKLDSYTQAIPEFLRFNIVENEVRNVY